MEGGRETPALAEPGNWSPIGHDAPVPGVEYYLGAGGLTKAEFFRVADSLQPID